MIDAAVAPIREQLEWAEEKVAALQAELVEVRVSERSMAKLAENATGEIVDLRKRLDAERDQAEQAEQRVAALQADLVEVRVAERGTSERAAATAAEIAELRRLLDVADRRIQGERTRAEQERELRTQAQGRLADKDATITGLVAEKQVLKQEVETLTELARARRSWWRRVFGR